MSASPTNDKPYELDLTDAIRQCGVNSISRQGPLVRISHSLEKNGKITWTTILFEVKPDGFFATLQNFEHQPPEKQGSKTNSPTNNGCDYRQWMMNIMLMP